MITYNRSAFGLNLIFQVHGSAVYRAIFPSVIAVGIFFLWKNCYKYNGFSGEDLGHPYAVGALVASASFLVVFRANQGYARYWEGCGAVHQMMSKWMDATIHAGVYHLQCDHYKAIKPPSYFDYPELNNLYLTRDRERGVNYDDEEENLDEFDKSGGGFGGGDDDDDSDSDAGGRIFPERMLNQHFSTNSTGVKQQQYLREQLKRKSVNRKVVINEEKIKRQKQAVVKSINYVSSPTGTGGTSKRRQHKAATFHISSDSTLSSLEAPFVRRLNRRTQSADDIEKLPTTLETRGENGTNNNINNINNSNNSNSNSSRNNKILNKNNTSQNNNDKPRFSNEFFELLQKKVAKGAPPDSQPGKGKPFPLWGRPRLDGGWGDWYTQDEKTPLATFASTKGSDNDDDDDDDDDNPKLPPEGFASIQGGRTPPLYLQELAHLSSLLVAVALSTLRNDIDGCESPLAFYEPGSDWPTVDPDKDDWMKVSSGFEHLRKSFLVFLGMGRSPEEQTRYNAGRPLPVLGGVSDAEIRFLQMARGPLAKTQLCWNWLSEFMMREHLAGSMGKVGPPIVSRCIQFLGDGMIFYNHARKIMFIPFPFVHAQLSVLFIVVMIPAIPFLMDQYTDEAWLGALLSFFTVLCLAGVNEVARELENPFRNVPNELPLVTFMAHYNEALITMYSGYHPDFFWNGQAILRQRRQAADTAAAKAAAASAAAEIAAAGAAADIAAAAAASEAASKTTTAQHDLSGSTVATTDNGSKAGDEEDEPFVLCSGSRAQGGAPWSPGAESKSATMKAATSSTTTTHMQPPSSLTKDDEVALLKQQLAKQAQLIEQLFAHVGSLEPPPHVAPEHVEEESTIVC